MMAYRGGNGASGAYSEDERDSRSGDDRPGSDLGDKPTYLLEHLATFTVNKESGIVSPADGMRRLLLLEKTTGIWSQKMQLCLDRQWVLIMDYESGNVIERFPASLIQEPTAFTSNGQMEMYNNVLVLIVGGGTNARSEMHIFQCQSISAVLLEQDLKNLRAGKLITQRDAGQPGGAHGNHRKSSPNGSGSHNNGRDAFNNYQHETDSEIDGMNDETSSTSSEKYEKDVTVLNHCFDDIEKFIARLQHAAAASRELERRRRNRKSKKKDPGEGLLTLRTKPPHEKEFIDIFAKFKLSFNLLAKLKAHIHDPNAPELVHFLFTPLALIVDASHDTYYDPNIPARVVNPLMTREAVNLLINCVTSKETELWRSLGDAWIIPRDQWKGNIVAYHPVFFDGWSPDYSVMDELDNPSTPTVKRRIEPLRHYAGGDYEYDPPMTDKYHHQQQQLGHQQMPGSPRDFSARSEISIDSIERNGGGPSGAGTLPIGLVAVGGMHHQHQQQQQQQHQAEQHMHHTAVPPPPSMTGGSMGQHIVAGGAVVAAAGAASADAWLDDVQSRGGKIVQVTYPRTANNDKELTVVRGEYLEILDDSRKWWKARNSRGNVAHVPHTIITPFNYADNGDTFNNPLYTQNYNKNFNSRVSNDPSDRYSQPIERNGSPSSGIGPDPRASGLPVAAAALAGSSAAAGASQADWVRNKHTDRSSFSSDDNVFSSAHSSLKKPHSVVPPPPPPLPPMVVPIVAATYPSKTNTTASRKSIVSQPAPQDEMQEELKNVLTLFRDKRRILDIVKTPEIFIQQSSAAAEVEKWLVAKGFTEKVVKKLNGFNGNELFSLKRHTMEDYFGTEEGRRLASQITIQRNISGYKTARSTELQAILAKARTKTGEN